MAYYDNSDLRNMTRAELDDEYERLGKEMDGMGRPSQLRGEDSARWSAMSERRSLCWTGRGYGGSGLSHVRGWR